MACATCCASRPSCSIYIDERGNRNEKEKINRTARTGGQPDEGSRPFERAASIAPTPSPQQRFCCALLAMILDRPETLRPFEAYLLRGGEFDHSSCSIPSTSRHFHIHKTELAMFKNTTIRKECMTVTTSTKAQQANKKLLTFLRSAKSRSTVANSSRASNNRSSASLATCCSRSLPALSSCLYGWKRQPRHMKRRLLFEPSKERQQSQSATTTDRPHLSL